MNQNDLAHKIRELQGVSLKVKDLTGMAKGSQTSREAIIKYALEQNSNYKGHDLDDLAKALMHRNDFLVQIGDKKVTAKEIREDVVERIQNPINIEANGKWFDQGKEIIMNMNDGDITADDIAKRGAFLEDIGSRQTELYALLSLYQTSTLPAAKAAVAKIQARLAKLEKVEKVVLKATRRPEQALNNQNVEEDEEAKARIYCGVLDYMRDGKSVPDNMKVKLELNDGVDFAYSLAEQIRMRGPVGDKKQVLDRINQLRGRQQVKVVAKMDKKDFHFDKDAYRKMMMQKAVLEKQRM
ncbi:MAG: hypothetical protein R3Y43_03775 [Alphaproteobacteria bacterium]